MVAAHQTFLTANETCWKPSTEKCSRVLISIFHPHPSDRLGRCLEAVKELHAVGGLLGTRGAEPTIKCFLDFQKNRFDGPRRHLHQVQILGVSAGGSEEQLMQSRPASEGEHLGQCAGEYEVLLYLLIESPGRLCPPGRDVRPRYHRSSYISTLGIMRQGAMETASPCGMSLASSTGR